ncbi:FadR/GntR family transcriptional regulator [Mycobacterium sp. NPDC003449]
MEQSVLISQLVTFLNRRGYEPGERIPSERELGLRFGTTRGQVREALALLEALRIIERRAKSGLFMASGVPSIEALALFARVGVPLNAEDIRQTVEMRRIHEVEAVKLACARRTPDDLDRMRTILAATDAAPDDPDVAAENDAKFHAAIVQATQNDLFWRIVNIFYLMTAERRRTYFRDADRRENSRREHHALFEAIVAGDGALGVRLMEAHLQGVDSYWRSFVSDDASAARARRKEES